MFSFAEACVYMERCWEGLKLPTSVSRSWPGNSCDRADMSIQWAFEFEKENHGREWDGDYYESIEKFFDARYAEWLKTATDTTKV